MSGCVGIMIHRMKKLYITITGILIVIGGWFFTVKPIPPFGGRIQPPTMEIDGRRVEFSYTDDNSGEDLLIYTDKKNYETLSQTPVLVAVVNTSGVAQDVSIQTYFQK